MMGIGSILSARSPTVLFRSNTLLGRAAKEELGKGVANAIDEDELGSDMVATGVVAAGCGNGMPMS